MAPRIGNPVGSNCYIVATTPSSRGKEEVNLVVVAPTRSSVLRRAASPVIRENVKVASRNGFLGRPNKHTLGASARGRARRARWGGFNGDGAAADLRHRLASVYDTQEMTSEEEQLHRLCWVADGYIAVAVRILERAQRSCKEMCRGLPFRVDRAWVTQ